MIEKIKQYNFVMDECGYTDHRLVEKVNEIIDVINNCTPLNQEPCVKIRDLTDEELKHFAEEMKKVRLQVLEQEPNYKSFCEFVAKTIMDEDFELNAGANAEIFCRKLAELGIVRADGDSWVLGSEE